MFAASLPPSAPLRFCLAFAPISLASPVSCKFITLELEKKSNLDVFLDFYRLIGIDFSFRVRIVEDPRRVYVDGFSLLFFSPIFLKVFHLGI